VDITTRRNEAMSDEGTVSLVVFSGTDDKLHAAAVLAVGAAAMGRKVNVFLQYWGLRAFRADGITDLHGTSPEAGEAGEGAMRAHGAAHHSALFRQAKDLGDVHIYACSDSMEMLNLAKEDLDPMVDGVWGVASLFMEADGPVTFI
jgi:peroxiredoxin family protein